MADTKGVRFAETPPGKSKRWSTNGDRPMRSPYPFPHIDPWSTISVLSIDGGRSRGYSSLIMMQALMEKVGEIERGLDPHATSSIHSSAFGPLDEEICAIPNPSAMPTSGYRPCHYFDYIAGVGTGGIIAMLLGRYRMSVGEAMEKYRDICAMVVERQLTSPQPKLKGQEPLLSTNPTTSKQSDARTVSLVPAWPGPNEYEGNLESDPKRCRTIVCGCDFRLQPFRSYPRSGQRRYDINDVILRCVPEDIAPGTPVDAKHYYSNPSRTVLKEISSLHDHEGSTEGAIDLLSIGAGINEPVSARANELQYLMCRQIQRVHKELSDHQPHQFPHLTDYRRLDPLPPPSHQTTTTTTTSTTSACTNSNPPVPPSATSKNQPTATFKPYPQHKRHSTTSPSLSSSSGSFGPRRSAGSAGPSVSDTGVPCSGATAGTSGSRTGRGSGNTWGARTGRCVSVRTATAMKKRGWGGAGCIMCMRRWEGRGRGGPQGR